MDLYEMKARCEVRMVCETQIPIAMFDVLT